MAHESKMVAYDVRAALHELPEKTMRFLASLNRCTVGVSRFSGDSHWERHPAGDELLHFLEGTADIVTLTDAGPVRSTAGAGSLFICRRGLWHRVLPRSPVSMVFATPGDGTEHSEAADPRQESGRRRSRGRRGGEVPTLAAHDLGAALEGLPELGITAATTAEEASAAVRTITTLDQCTLGVMRYSGLTPWERHPDGDELLHVLEGGGRCDRADRRRTGRGERARGLGLRLPAGSLAPAAPAARRDHALRDADRDGGDLVGG
jgi:quercetin dioxygenase-like cupin family protein